MGHFALLGLPESSAITNFAFWQAQIQSLSLKSVLQINNVEMMIDFPFLNEYS